MLYAGSDATKGVGNLLYAMKEVQQSAPDLSWFCGGGIRSPQAGEDGCSSWRESKVHRTAGAKHVYDTISRAEVLVLPTQTA